MLTHTHTHTNTQRHTHSHTLTPPHTLPQTHTHTHHTKWPQHPLLNHMDKTTPISVACLCQLNAANPKMSAELLYTVIRSNSLAQAVCNSLGDKINLPF